MTTRAKRRLIGAITGIGLLVVVVVQLTPFYIAVTTALKPKTDFSSQWLPPLAGVYWGNFVTAIEQGGILRAIGNSVVVTTVSTLLVCLLGAMAAYPLTRRPSLVNRSLMFLIVGALMIPPLSILVPLYTMMNQLNAVNTLWGIVLIMVTGQLPLSIFLYASFLRTIPFTLEEAATVDGANTMQILFRIVFPLLKPVTATVVIISGVFIWNEYQLSLYMLTTSDTRTIAPAISAFFSQYSSNLGAAAAASLMGMMPVLIAYLFLQKYFIKGMVAGSER
jgi:raffinose/stachyose/melibiose transport system permease protein